MASKKRAKTGHRFGKGNPGRPKGAVNKTTADLKAAIMRAFDKAGGDEWLVSLSTENPQAFATLLGKLIPRDLKIDGDLRVNLVDAIRKARERASGG